LRPDDTREVPARGADARDATKRCAPAGVVAILIAAPDAGAATLGRHVP
jgi:hypothetical protein